MRQSQLFTKTQRSFPKEEKSINAQLLIRGGFIHKEMAGVYSFLPLGWKVLKKIENIIREEINAIDGQEIFMPVLHPKENWQKTDRWKIKEMFKLKSRAGKDYALGWTHEEIITPLVKTFVSSYKDLPQYIYQIQTKMRDELRAKSGLLRAREFIMKDLYSFHISQEDLDNYYDKVKEAYFKIFDRCNLLPFTYLTLASGGTFSKYSHEFQAITSAGEDIIYICRQCDLAINREIKKETPECPACGNKSFIKKKAIEIGNIFKLGTKYSEAFKFFFKDKNSNAQPVFMGCYGIGLGRLMGTIVEIFHDDKGIIWPKSVTPYMIHLLDLTQINKKDKAEKVYHYLIKAGFEVLYDDRLNISAGEKLVESDLIGLPFRLIVSEKTLQSESIEFKERKEKTSKLIKLKELINFLKKIKSNDF